MMFQVSIDTGSAAFEDSETSEVVRLLRGIADRVEDSGDSSGRVLLDANGNACGVWGFVSTEERTSA